MVRQYCDELWIRSPLNADLFSLFRSSTRRHDVASRVNKLRSKKNQSHNFVIVKTHSSECTLISASRSHHLIGIRLALRRSFHVKTFFLCSSVIASHSEPSAPPVLDLVNTLDFVEFCRCDF